MSNLRREVLQIFKQLHRTRQKVFKGDIRALKEGRLQINEHFTKNKDEDDNVEIENMIKLAKDVDRELRSNVIQAVEKKSGVFKLNITEETTKLDNKTYNDEITREPCGGCDCGLAEARNNTAVKEMDLRKPRQPIEQPT